MQIGPYPANSVADHSPSDLTEPRTIEIPQIDDVGGHRNILAPVARSTGCANQPAFFLSERLGLFSACEKGAVILAVFPAKAGTHPPHGHRPSPV